MDKIIGNAKEAHFTIIDNYILNNASLNAMEQIVYVHLKKYCSQSNKCFPCIKKLAESIDLSSNTIRKTLKSLKDKGFIDIQQRFNTSNEYILLPFPDYAEEIKAIMQEEKGIGSVLQAYSDNINPLYGSMEREKLINWLEAFNGSGDVLVKAIEIAVLKGVRKLKYIETILINWQEGGVKNLEQCEAFQKHWEEKRGDNKNGTRSYSKDKRTDSKRNYDFSKYGDLSM